MNYQRFILFRFPQEEITSQRESRVPSAKQGSQHPHSVSKMQSLPQNKNTKLLKGKSTTLQPRIIRHVSRQRVTDNFPAKHVSGAIHINWYKWGVKTCVLAGLCQYTYAYLSNLPILHCSQRIYVSLTFSNYHLPQIADQSRNHT